jgi:hypothetical protein
MGQGLDFSVGKPVSPVLGKNFNKETFIIILSVSYKFLYVNNMFRSLILNPVESFLQRTHVSVVAINSIQGIVVNAIILHYVIIKLCFALSC